MTLLLIIEVGGVDLSANYDLIKFALLNKIYWGGDK